jgi:hypothetical protein
LKKRTKKLLPVDADGAASKGKSLFASFSSEKEDSCFLSCADLLPCRSRAIVASFHQPGCP